jgi:nitrous oxidase accessory protein NosD
MLAAAALAAAGLLGTAPTASATVAIYYVSGQGSDAAAGTAQAPWRSLSKATATAPAGARIVVADGDYAPFEVTRPLQSITAAPGAHPHVHGAPGVRDIARVAAPGASLHGLTLSGCVPTSTPVGGYDVGGSAVVRIEADAVTLSGLTIGASRGTNDHGLPFGCYGVLAVGADATTVTGNDISGTGTGVYLNGGGRLSLIADNRIHDNDVLVRNTYGGNDDYGANGITFANVDALPGALAQGNTVTGNAGPSADYGVDGGAFEIYNSSHVQILGNTVADNENVLETGTSQDGGSLLGQCVGNTFAGNDVTGRTAGSRLGRSVGMILRCASAMTVAANTFRGIDWFVFDLETGDVFSSDVRGLAITGNTVVEQPQKVYHLGIDPTSSALVVDGNRFGPTGPVFASYADGSTSPTLADWRARTGRDLASGQG